MEGDRDGFLKEHKSGWVEWVGEAKLWAQPVFLQKLVRYALTRFFFVFFNLFILLPFSFVGSIRIFFALVCEGDRQRAREGGAGRKKVFFPVCVCCVVGVRGNDDG